MVDTTKTLEANSKFNAFDTDGDGIVTDAELANAEKIMELENRKLQIENEDKKEDAQRNMAWFALLGMLLYPFSVVMANLFNLDTAPGLLGDMAPTYFVSVAAIVAAFYAKEGYTKGK